MHHVKVEKMQLYSIRPRSKGLTKYDQSYILHIMVSPATDI